jgi:ABC-2 type transport system ATP-binding protein
MEVGRMNRIADARATRPAEILSAEDLRKTYGDRVALKGLTFTLDAGRVLGFLGPNGAGKTTSIRILTTILRPTAGRFVVDGISSEHPVAIRRRIGVLPEGLGFPKQMTARGYLVYFAQLYGRPSAEARRVASELLEDVGLQNRKDSDIGSFSHGMRQRLGIARALVNDPAVVFLDEPTLGLDPRGQRELLQLVQRIARERNKGVVLCSHLLSEIEGVCDDVVIMNAGTVVARGTVAAGTVSEVVARAAAPRSAVVRVAPDDARRAAAVLAVTPGVGGAEEAPGRPGELRVDLASGNGAGDQAAALRALLDAGIAPLGLAVEGARLSDAFLEMTGAA